MTNRKEARTTLAVYPGTFDPIHNGHIDVVRRSVQLFDEVIVAVAHNPDKDHALFTPDERVDMIREALHDLEPKARVDKFHGLSVDYAERIGAKVIIRSLRAGFAGTIRRSALIGRRSRRSFQSAIELSRTSNENGGRDGSQDGRKQRDRRADASVRERALSHLPQHYG